MSDTIDRQAAIDAIRELESGEDFNFNNGLICAMNNIAELPSVQSESAEMLSGRIWDEWCTGCKEYDQERHCCPRFNRVIRTALDDAKPEGIRRGRNE